MGGWMAERIVSLPACLPALGRPCCSVSCALRVNVLVCVACAAAWLLRAAAAVVMRALQEHKQFHLFIS
eukprot:1138621-Pelagomonas_calceolata.AAC.1